MSFPPLLDRLSSSPDALSRDIIFIALAGVALLLGILGAFLKRKK